MGLRRLRSERAAAGFHILGELALMGLALVFAMSHGQETIRYRALLGLVAVSLPVAAWGVTIRGWSSPGWRLWLVFAAGLILSLAVRGENLARPPSTPAEACAIACGLAAMLSVLFSGDCAALSGFGAGLAGAVVVLGAILGLLFHSVAAQNSLDAEVVQNARAVLAEYTLLLLGTAIVIRRPASFLRVALAIAVVCAIHVVRHHAGGASE
jgi:hypothetical protein